MQHLRSSPCLQVEENSIALMGGTQQYQDYNAWLVQWCLVREVIMSGHQRHATLENLSLSALTGFTPPFKCDSVIKRNQPNCPKNTQGAGGRFLRIAKSGQISYTSV